MGAPALARLLGYGGLIPFLASALGAWAGAWAGEGAGEGASADLALRSLLGYGAVILSFVGAVHWGVSLAREDEGRRPARLLWSVAPALVGWAASLAGGAPGLAAMAAAFAAAWAVDRGPLGLGAFPAWYRSLRTPLTLGAAGSLLAAIPVA